jgi:dienelactone hydrolase
MTNILKIIVTFTYVIFSISNLNAQSFRDYNSENTVIKNNAVPNLNTYSNEEWWGRVATFWGQRPITPLIPAFDGKGFLLASWTPSTKPDAPTFVIAHGGGGINTTAFQLGADIRAMGDANILIVDSIWSRGRISNGGNSINASGKTLSSNARMFDLVAAGRWLSTQGVNPKKTYAIGMSQGGWGVLRAFTNDPVVTELVKPLYAGGVSLYPPCEEPGTKHTEERSFIFHKLGPYHSKVLLITGGLDTLTPVSYCSESTLKSVDRWLHWEDATHSFNESIGGAFKRFGTHKFCYNEKRVKQMMNEIGIFSLMLAQ